MATWREFAAFVKSRYTVLSEQPEELRILVRFDDERSQAVVLAREVLDRRDEWVQMVSPCGLAAQVNLKVLLEEVGHTTVVGGIAIMGEHLVVRHSLPLANLDTNEFVDPLALLAGTADQLEEMFVGGDGY